MYSDFHLEESGEVFIYFSNIINIFSTFCSCRYMQKPCGHASVTSLVDKINQKTSNQIFKKKKVSSIKIKRFHTSIVLSLHK